MTARISTPLHFHLHEANRLSWNAATIAHNSHKGDQGEFLKSGGSTLFPEELELLGDVSGRRLVHLQCNSGQDTLSLARLGAEVTGVDISDEAIGVARELSGKSGLPAHFERADLFEWFEQAGKQERAFDIAFSSYGAICWLSDINLWAQGLASVLKPGGRFVLLEFHPFAMVFDEHLKPHYHYFHRGPVKEDGVGDYVAQSGDGLVIEAYQEGSEDFANPHPSYEFNWGVGNVVTALIQAGMRLDRLVEYPYMNGWRAFEDMRDAGERKWALPDTMPSMPLMYGLVASRPALRPGQG